MVGPAQASALLKVPDTLAAQVQATQDWLGAASDDGAPRHIVTLGDAAYPPSLLAIEDPPCLLYVVGRLPGRDSGSKQAPALAESAPAASELIA